MSIIVIIIIVLVINAIDGIIEYLVPSLKPELGNPGFAEKSGIYISQNDTCHSTIVHQKRSVYFTRYEKQDKKNGTDVVKATNGKFT